MILSKAWCAFMLTAPVVSIIAYCTNQILFDYRNDMLRRVTAIGVACGVGALFIWLQIAVLDMARDGFVPIFPGNRLWLQTHHAFRYGDTPALFWIWLVLDVFVISACWLIAVIAGARAGFGLPPDQHVRARRHIPSTAHSKSVPSATRGSKRRFPLNIPGACIGASEVLSIVWVHAGLVS